jgi:chromosome partitioning protein
MLNATTVIAYNAKEKAMSWLVAFVGQKGGTGKSRLAQAFTTEIARSGVDVLLADTDKGPTGAVAWGEVRAQNGWQPPVTVQRIERTDIRAVLGRADVVVLDTAGFADRITRELAELSNLVVVPVGTDLGDWQPTIDLLHQLANAGLPIARLAPVIVRATTKSKADLARQYLKAAGYTPLKHETYFLASYQDAFNVGKAMTEAPGDTPREEALRQVKDIAGALKRAQELEAERTKAPKPRKPPKDKEHSR